MKVLRKNLGDNVQYKRFLSSLGLLTPEEVSLIVDYQMLRKLDASDEIYIAVLDYRSAELEKGLPFFVMIVSATYARLKSFIKSVIEKYGVQPGTLYIYTTTKDELAGWTKTDSKFPGLRWFVKRYLNEKGRQWKSIFGEKAAVTAREKLFDRLANVAAEERKKKSLVHSKHIREMGESR